MVDKTTSQTGVSDGSVSSTRVEERSIISAPTKTIQVERVSISAQQKSSMATAFRAGKAVAAKSKDR